MPFHPKLYRIAFALTENPKDAEDILQDVYLKLWNKRNNLANVKNYEAFCITVTKNLSLDFLRSKKNKQKTNDVENISLISDSPENDFINQDELDKIIVLIEKLPEKQKQIIRLRGIDGCTLEEIEEITGLNAVNVRVQLSRARKIIKEKFQKLYSI